MADEDGRVELYDRRRFWDVAAVGSFIAATFVVHPVSYVTSRPYWIDEAFVASLARAPLSRILELDRSTPLGWAYLAHFVPGHGEQQRLVPLAFAAGAAAMAYVLARCLPWRSTAVARLAGVIVGVAVLLSPLMLLRNDLKQYTADAFFALVLLTLGCRAETDLSRRALMWLAVASIGSVLFSGTAPLVVAAVFAGLFVTACVSKTTPRIRDVAVVGVGVGIVVAVYLEMIVVPRTPPSFYAYWRGQFLTGSPAKDFWQWWYRMRDLAPNFAVPTLLLGALCIAGLIVLFRLHHPALAVSIPLLWVEMVVMGVAKRYPFLDRRTSTFLLVVTMVLAAIGLAGVVSALATRSRLFTAVVVVTAALGYGYGVRSSVRDRSIPREDDRSVADFVAQNRETGDVIVVSFASNWGFSYYWPHGHTRYLNDAELGQGFTTQLVGLPRVVYAGQTKAVLDQIVKRSGYPNGYAVDALRQALVLANTAGATGRIWLVRTHLLRGEAATWNNAFRTFHVTPMLRKVGTEYVALIQVQLANAARLRFGPP